MTWVKSGWRAPAISSALFSMNALAHAVMTLIWGLCSAVDDMVKEEMRRGMEEMER